MRTPLVMISLWVWLVACSAVPSVGDDAGSPRDSGVQPEAGLADGGALAAAHPPLPAGVTLRSGDFATGTVCSECHSATATTNVDEQGRPVGLFEQWSATPMANATRDPLFRAAVANEIARAPAAADAIASVCLTCHAGMGRHTQLRAGRPTTFALPYAATDEGALARDGVSCTLSRRAFLQVRLLDAAGALLFESGGVDGAARLVGADGQPLGPERRGGSYHPHRARVTSAGEVVVYESVMDDGVGQPSFDLLGAEGYLKDNRLLPRGHVDTTTGAQSTAPVGVSDADFRAGFDDVRFELPLAGTPTRVEVTLRYQSFGPRYLEELLFRPTPEATALRSMLQPSMLAPELVDEVVASVP